jgi:O-antigen/teichoic acid export membrane protein
MMVATLALPQAFFRSYLKEAATSRQRERVLAASLLMRLLLSAAFAFLFALIAAPLTVLIFGSADRTELLLLIAPIVFFDTLNLIPLSFLRAERRPAPYAALAFFRAVFGTVVIVILVVALHLGVLGVLIGSAISAVSAAALGLLVLARGASLKLRVDPVLWRHMLVFSIPLVPASIAAWGLNLSDRYVIGAFDGFHAVGLYSVGYTIGLIMNALVIQPFGLAWGAAYWEFAHEGPAEPIVSRAMTLFVVVACVPAMALSVFGVDAMRLLLSPEFLPGRYVIPFSAFGYLAYGMYSIAGTGLNLASQTRWLPITVAAAAVANLLMNLLGVPLLGYMAAAYSTLISYALLAVLTGTAAQRYFPVRWDYRRMVATLAVALGLTAAGIAGPDLLIWRLACFAAFPLGVVMTGIIPMGDVARLMRAAMRWRRLLPGAS